MFTAAKFLLGIAFLAALFYFKLIDFSLFADALHAPHLLAFAFLCLLSTVFLAAWRWQILINALGMQLNFRRILSFTFIGQFFNIFLPGGYGGDLVRIGLAHRHNPNNFGTLVMSSLVDRISGLLGLLIIALIIIAFIPAEFQRWLLTLTLGGLVLGIGGLFVVLRYRALFEKCLGYIPKPVGPVLVTIFQKVTTIFIRYGEHKKSLFGALLLSIIQYVLVLLALYALGVAMNISLHWFSYFIAGVTGLIANALPLAPGGLGIGETAFGKMASFLAKGNGSEGYSTVFLALRGLTVLTALIGLGPFLVYRDAIRETIDQDKEKE